MDDDIEKKWNERPEASQNEIREFLTAFHTEFNEYINECSINLKDKNNFNYFNFKYPKDEDEDEDELFKNIIQIKLEKNNTSVCKIFDCSDEEENLAFNITKFQMKKKRYSKAIIDSIEKICGGSQINLLFSDIISDKKNQILQKQHR